MSINRYDSEVIHEGGCDMCVEGMSAHSVGDYVLYCDHQSDIKKERFDHRKIVTGHLNEILDLRDKLANLQDENNELNKEMEGM